MCLHVDGRVLLWNMLTLVKTFKTFCFLWQYNKNYNYVREKKLTLVKISVVPDALCISLLQGCCIGTYLKTISFTLAFNDNDIT